MKLLSFAIFILSFQAFGSIIVDRSNLNCQFARTGERVFTTGLIDLNENETRSSINVDQVLNDIQTEIERIVVGLEIANDPLTRKDHTICIGVYDDVKGANAGAYGADYILFGARLIKLMSDNSLKLSYYNAFYPVFYHELAHTLQNLRLEKYEFALNNIRIKKKELQADCLAGAMMQLHGRVSYNTYMDAMALFSHLGDHNIVQNHGIKQQRQAAYAMGVFAIKQSTSHYSHIDSNYLFKGCRQEKIDKLIFN